jgi:uncharacterized protein YjbJ (UPF0337 family)
MSALTDKIKGVANEVTGKGKQAIGRESNDPDLEAEGAAQEGKGHIQQAVGKGKDAVKNAIDKL